MTPPPPQLAGKGDERLSDVLQDAAHDTFQTITKSQTPVRDLLVKHKHSLQMFASGSLVGWLGFKVFKFITLGIIKVIATICTPDLNRMKGLELPVLLDMLAKTPRRSPLPYQPY